MGSKVYRPAKRKVFDFIVELDATDQQPISRLQTLRPFVENDRADPSTSWNREHIGVNDFRHTAPSFQRILPWTHPQPAPKSEFPSRITRPARIQDAPLSPRREARNQRRTRWWWQRTLWPWPACSRQQARASPNPRRLRQGRHARAASTDRMPSGNIEPGVPARTSETMPSGPSRPQPVPCAHPSWRPCPCATEAAARQALPLSSHP
jgi:hypothetical protein